MTLSARRRPRAGRVVVLGLAAAWVAACLGGADVLVDRSWSLVSIGGRPPAAPAVLSFAGDGTFTVDTGCNGGGGTYHLAGNRIELDSEALTERACAGALGEQEVAILRVLEGRPSYAVESRTGRLILTGPDGGQLVLEPG